MFFATMDGGSPSCRQEKRSKRNQDCIAVAKPTGRTKAVCPCTGAEGSRAARHCDGQGSFVVASSHQADAYVGDDPIVDDEEEALERASHTIAAPPTCTPTHGPGFVTQLVLFTSVSLIMQEPAMAPNPAGGWTPPLPVDYHHWVKDIRSNRGRNLYAEDEKDL